MLENKFSKHLKDNKMQLVIAYKEQVSTTSVLVAQKFGKRHDDVLRAIRNLECSPEFSLRNFAEGDYENRGKKYPMYVITRDGFTMLAMGFTGKTAAKFREEFIEEFNRMEAVLRLGKPPVLLPTYQKRILSEPTKDLPEGYWSIFDESHHLMLFVETTIGSVSQFDLLDGSIGTRWCKFREDKTWAVETSTCTHEFNDVRGARTIKCYHLLELLQFRIWLKNTYKPMYLYDYLHGKYAREKNRVMLDKVEDMLPKLLKAS